MAQSKAPRWSDYDGDRVAYEIDLNEYESSEPDRDEGDEEE